MNTTGKGTFQKGNKVARGGARTGAGRKPEAARQLREQFSADEKAVEVEYAFGLYVSVMRDETEKLEQRLAAADWITNRVLGKPKQAVDLGTVKLLLVDE